MSGDGGTGDGLITGGGADGSTSDVPAEVAEPKASCALFEMSVASIVESQASSPHELGHADRLVSFVMLFSSAQLSSVLSKLYPVACLHHRHQKHRWNLARAA